MDQQTIFSQFNDAMFNCTIKPHCTSLRLILETQQT